MGVIGRGTAVVATIGVAGLAAIAAHTAHAHPDDVVGGGGTAALVLQIAASLAAWSAGLYAVARLRARGWGSLLAAAGVAVLLTVLATPAVHSSAVFTVALAGGALVPQLAGAAALLHAAPGRSANLIGASCVLVVWLLLGVLPALLFDPLASGCFACASNHLLVHADPELHDALLRWGLRATVVSGALLAGVALLRCCRSAPAVRAVTAPVVVAGALAASVGAIGAAHALAQPAAASDPMSRALWLAECASVLAMSLGVGARAATARRLRERVADIVVGALPDADLLRSTLAAGVGDARLELAFPRQDGATVDAAGSVIGPPAADQVVFAVTRGDRVVAEIRHDRALTAVPERLASAVRAAGLALEHAASRARLSAEVAELSASRIRVIEAGDSERRRLERDLHDGTQQQLIAIAIAIQAAHEETTDPIGQEALAASRYEVRHALDELRTIAHGIHPVTLTDAGLEAALRELAEGGTVPVRLERVPSRRADPPVEAAAYRAVADAVRCAEQAGATVPVRVSVERTDVELRTRVDVEGGERAAYESALAHAADRAVALGGQVRITDGVTIEVSTPCAS